jgi:hypothetical protein
MAEQESDDKSPQRAGGKENGHAAIDNLRRQREQLVGQLLVPGNVIGLASAYLLLVTAVIGFGVLAFYTGHKIAQEICFWISIPLLAAIPVVFIWYLLPTRREKIKREAPTGMRERLIRFANSPMGRFFERHERLINFGIYGLDIFNIAKILQMPFTSFHNIPAFHSQQS